jgi:hypothetical protein
MLTPSQLTTLKADILSIPELAAQPLNDDGHFYIAAYYNVIASPAWRVWKTSVSTAEIKDAINWTEYIGRSVGERSAFELLVSNHVINPAKANVRQGISDMFSGVQGQVTRNALLALGKRDATRAEKLFSIGTGSDAVPATMTFEGNLSYSDVSAARNS